MPVYANIDGAQKQLSALYSNVGGAQKQLSSLLGNIAGASKELLTSPPPAPTSVTGASVQAGTSAWVSWSSVSGATKYHIYLYKSSVLNGSWSTASTGANIPIPSEWVVGTTYNFGVSSEKDGLESTKKMSPNYSVIA